MIYKNTDSLLIFIRQKMIEDKINMKMLGDKMNKAQSSVSTLFKSNNMKLDSLKDICDALGYDIDISLIKKGTD